MIYFGVLLIKYKQNTEGTLRRKLIMLLGSVTASKSRFR